MSVFWYPPDSLDLFLEEETDQPTDPVKTLSVALNVGRCGQLERGHMCRERWRSSGLSLFSKLTNQHPRLDFKPMLESFNIYKSQGD